MDHFLQKIMSLVRYQPVPNRSMARYGTMPSRGHGRITPYRGNGKMTIRQMGKWGIVNYIANMASEEVMRIFGPQIQAVIDEGAAKWDKKLSDVSPLLGDVNQFGTALAEFVPGGDELVKLYKTDKVARMEDKEGYRPPVLKNRGKFISGNKLPVPTSNGPVDYFQKRHPGAKVPRAVWEEEMKMDTTNYPMIKDRDPKKSRPTRDPRGRSRSDAHGDKRGNKKKQKMSSEQMDASGVVNFNTKRVYTHQKRRRYRHYKR